MNEKQQIVHIHGGMTFNSYEDYLRVLSELDISFEHPKDMSQWNRDYYRVLDKNNYEVMLPEMPSGNNAKYSEWKIWFEKIIPFLNNKDVIFVGHSLGGTFLAKYLSENEFKHGIKQLHLVAAVYDYEDEWEQLGDFRIKEDFPGLLSDRDISIHLYHSHDDDLVPFEEMEKFHQKLPQAEIHAFNDQGHFLGNDFPELFEAIQKQA